MVSFITTLQLDTSEGSLDWQWIVCGRRSGSGSSYDFKDEADPDNPTERNSVHPLVLDGKIVRLNGGRGCDSCYVDYELNSIDFLSGTVFNYRVPMPSATKLNLYSNLIGVLKMFKSQKNVPTNGIQNVPFLTLEKRYQGHACSPNTDSLLICDTDGVGTAVAVRYTCRYGDHTNHAVRAPGCICEYRRNNVMLQGVPLFPSLSLIDVRTRLVRQFYCVCTGPDCNGFDRYGKWSEYDNVFYE